MPDSEVYEFPVRVYYEDTDVGGVVYHSKYLNYCERARTEVLRSLGYEQDELIDNQDVIFAVRHLAIDYNRPAVFNDELVVRTRIDNMRKASMVFLQKIMRKQTDELLSEIRVQVACLSASRLKPRAIPADIVAALEESRAD